MLRKVAVSIECGDRFCNTCWEQNNGECRLFGPSLEWDETEESFRRCLACRKAEVKKDAEYVV